MDETTANGGANAATDLTTPLTQNEYVRELFAILESNGKDTSGLSAMLGKEQEMQNTLAALVSWKKQAEKQLDAISEIQNHPMKSALKNIIKTLEVKIEKLKEQLTELRSGIITGCKNAVAAFKGKGIAALDKLASFFHIKGVLKAIDRTANESVAQCNSNIQRIDVFSREYHSAGRAVKNMARMFIGKEPIDAQKEAGRLARAVSAPFKIERAAMLKISGLAVAMTKSLEQLENTAAAKRDAPVREKKPKLLEELRDAKQLVEQRKLEMPVPERVKAKGAVEV